MSTKRPDRKISSAIPSAMNFHSAWEEYIRGNVVSQNSVRLIRSFLMNTIAAAHYEDDHEAESEADRSDADSDVPPLNLTVHALKTSMSAAIGAEESNASNCRRGVKRSKPTDMSRTCDQPEHLWRV